MFLRGLLFWKFHYYHNFRLFLVTRSFVVIEKQTFGVTHVSVTSAVRIQRIKLNFVLETFINILDISHKRKKTGPTWIHATKTDTNQTESHGLNLKILVGTGMCGATRNV